MQKMTPPEIKSFLTDTARTGKLATVRADGRPHVAPIWFEVDEDDSLLFMTWHESVKGLNIQRDGRVSICIDDETPPFHFVVIEGTAAVEAVDQATLLYWSTRIGGRYMGADKAEDFGKRNAVEGELLIRVTPTKTIAQKNLAD